MTNSESATVGSPEPTAGDPPGWQHSELFSRRSLIGAIALLVAVGAFFMIPPFVDANTDYSIAGPDGRIAIDDFFSLQLADGWGIESQTEIITVIAKGGASVVLTPSIESDTPADEYAQTLTQGLDDGSGTWRVDPIQDFTTDDGLSGVTYVAHSVDTVAANWILAADGRLLIFAGTASETAFKAGLDDMNQMARSIRFEATPEVSE